MTSVRFIKAIILPVILVALSFILRLIALMQTDYGNGWDAYFYLIQIKALITGGSMHSNDVSIIYPYLFLIKLMTPDYVLAYKYAIALISGFYILSWYYLAKEIAIEKNNITNALLISAYVLFSPTITYMASQFPKNLLGLVLLNFFLLFWLKDKKWAIVLFFVLTFFTHRLTAGIICIFIVFHLVSKRKFLWMTTIAIVLILLSLLMPGLINFYDIERFKGVFSMTPQFAPVSFIKLFSIEKISYYWMIEILVSFLTVIISIFIIYRQNLKTNLKKFYFIIIIICIILIFPFYKFDINGPAFRFFLSFLCIAPVFILFMMEKLNRPVKIALICILFIGSLFSYQTYSPEKYDPPYQTYSKITEKALSLLKNKSFDIIVAHKGLAEYFTFTTGIDALPWQPESKYTIDKTWRITSGISLNDFKYYFKEDLNDSIKKIGIDYFLVSEIWWQKFINKVKKSDDLDLLKTIYSDKNPYKIRPDYLMKGKK